MLNLSRKRSTQSFLSRCFRHTAGLAFMGGVGLALIIIAVIELMAFAIAGPK